MCSFGTLCGAFATCSSFGTIDGCVATCSFGTTIDRRSTTCSFGTTIDSRSTTCSFGTTVGGRSFGTLGTFVAVIFLFANSVCDCVLTDVINIGVWVCWLCLQFTNSTVCVAIVMVGCTGTCFMPEHGWSGGGGDAGGGGFFGSDPNNAVCAYVLYSSRMTLYVDFCMTQPSGLAVRSQSASRPLSTISVCIGPNSPASHINLRRPSGCLSIRIVFVERGYWYLRLINRIVDRHMEAHFRSKDGGHAFFECNGAVARLPLPQAYSVYLSGPEGNRATTALADGSWALVAIHGRAVEKKKVWWKCI